MCQSYALQEVSSSSSYFLRLETGEPVQLLFRLGYLAVQENLKNQQSSIWGLVEAMLHSNFLQLFHKLKHNTG
jgi:hypothetical protein